MLIGDNKLKLIDAYITLDPGHGGSDPGAVKYVKEAFISLRVCKYARNYLKSKGVKVHMTRTTDKHVGLTPRVTSANQRKTHLYVSVHLNAATSEEASGAECWYSINGGTGKTLAKNILLELKDIGQNMHSASGKIGGAMKTKKNENGEDYFYVIRATNMPAVIAELGFVTNKKDARDVDTKKEQKIYGEAIAKGIINTLESM